MQGPVAQLQRLAQFGRVGQRAGARCQRCLQCRLGPGAGRAQAFAQRLEHGPIRLGAGADALAQRVAGALHGQIVDQPLDIPQKQIGGHPARQ
ncbi:hypothetical protein D3C77_723560 [compost metagenome]